MSESFAPMSPDPLSGWKLALVISMLVAGGCTSAPTGESGPAADALARNIQKAVNLDGWQKTGAVTWNFAGRKQHLWDRKRDFIRVVMGDLTVWRHLWSDRGRVEEDGQPVTDAEERAEALARAYDAWVNDAFWLEPFSKFFDQGVTRQRIGGADGEKLLISFSKGGNTPGDSYLFVLDESGRPTAWRMWVSIIPTKGMEASWEGWQQLETGAWVSTRHETPIFTLDLTDVRGAESLSELTGGSDPFASLLE